MRFGRAGTKSLALSPRAVEEIDKESYHKASRRETEKEKERRRAEGKIRSQAHDYTALLVNTMLRKHHGAVQRGHDVSILSSREPSLEGPRGTRCSPHPLPDATIFSPYHPSSSSSPCCSPPCDRALLTLFVKACRTFAKGVPHTGPHRSPRYLSRQISWLRCTPCNA